MADDPAELHPTNLKTAVIFLDILFGVLLGIIVLEFRPDYYLEKSAWQRVLFSALYAALLLKFFFHWHGIHSDSAILGSFFRYSANLSNYLTGIFVAFTYFVCIKLLVLWFEHPIESSWAMPWFFTVLAAFKIADTLSNQFAVPRLVGDLIARGKPAALPKETWRDAVRILDPWFSSEQRRIVLAFLLAVPFLVVAAVWRSATSWCINAALFLLIEGSVERQLTSRRGQIWRKLVEIRALGALSAPK